LSERRANAVRNELIASGIDPAQLVARGMGESYPKAPNDTAAGRQQNRRVEVIVQEGAAGA
jgi:OOP family OmpA-OmpF porin